MRRLGLRRGGPQLLTIRRRRCGRGFVYLRPDNTPIRDRAELRRLASLAVPPAYEEVMLAQDPAAHLQAIGRDSAGRIQYRYHPAWEKVREQRKARRLARLVDVLPKVRRALARHLAGKEPSRELALAAVIELVARSAIRAGSESYARLYGTRGAATLLKSNITIDNDRVILRFRGKGGQSVDKEFRAPRFASAVRVLCELPGRRLFQYRNGEGIIRKARRRDANAFLREIAGTAISLKDFRTLVASAIALESLAAASPAATERRRRSQIGDALRVAADELANTPTVCRKSYVHETVVAAFEDGLLERFSRTLGSARSQPNREAILARLLDTVDG
jgi:DNA topoisomerase I